MIVVAVDDCTPLLPRKATRKIQKKNNDTERKLSRNDVSLPCSVRNGEGSMKRAKADLLDGVGYDGAKNKIKCEGSGRETFIPNSPIPSRITVASAWLFSVKKKSDRNPWKDSRKLKVK